MSGPPVQTEAVTPAELKTAREALGLPSEWVADTAQVALRTVRHWETGATRVPDDVAAAVELLAADICAHARGLLGEHTAGPVTLLRYRDEETLREHTGLAWPPATHAIAQLRERGITARLIWFDQPDYTTWAVQQPHPTPTDWAAQQPWQSEPRP